MDDALRVALIGAGDIEFHYSKLLGIPREKFDLQIGEIAKALVNADAEIIVLPDRGVSFEVAKKYRDYGGRKVFATAPLADKDFGVKHLDEYLNAKINGRKLIDKILDTDNWYRQDLLHCTFGDIVLMLGISLGSMGELVYGAYMYKLFSGKKDKVKLMQKGLHPEIRIGLNQPFTLIVYRPFIKEKLNFEIEEYIKRLDGKVIYAKDSGELINILKQISTK